MKMAHDHMGHFGYKKVLKIQFLWPGNYKDVLGWCKQCDRCQKTKKTNVPRAPLITNSSFYKPFEKVAFDIAGPFPRSKNGYKYVLSAICLASRFHEAIALKDVRAETVAEGMIEIFSRKGMPRQLRSDQGSQFVGKLVKQLCTKPNIDKLRTTPYHPQSNGCVERWHGTLVADKD